MQTQGNPGGGKIRKNTSYTSVMRYAQTNVFKQKHSLGCVLYHPQSFKT